MSIRATSSDDRAPRRASVDEIDRKRNVNYLFAVLFVAVTLKEIQADDVSIRRAKGLPTRLEWFEKLRRAVKAGIDQFVRPLYPRNQRIKGRVTKTAAIQLR